MQRTTVILVDDHALVRQSLRALLEAEDDMTVVGEAENGHQAVQISKRLKPEVIIMDIMMPGLNGLAATEQISRECPKSKVLILSCYSNDEYVRQMCKVGASGYLLKTCAARELVAAIREIKKGNSVFSPAVSKRFLEHCRASTVTPPCEKKALDLTLRQRQVLRLIAEGYRTKHIAKELLISLKTAEKLRLRLKYKLESYNVYNVADLTRYALDKGIIDISQGSGTCPPSA
jgi:DNA-binding NarL/FixJ family response regulator